MVDLGFQVGGELGVDTNGVGCRKCPHAKARSAVASEALHYEA